MNIVLGDHPLARRDLLVGGVIVVGVLVYGLHLTSIFTV
jgi:hypothetical protein